MAKLIPPTQKVYVVELTQDEAELVLMLTGQVDLPAAVALWDALDDAVRGDRIDYIIDGRDYEASVTIKEVV